MFKVVIIDDEALVRIGLKSIINWEEQNCELIGEASNGRDGYDLIMNTKPDIVITDIKMPVMDGLEMIEKLLEENTKLKYIILSSYDEFNLVRRVMKYGIENYVIKLELEPDILINILSQLKEKIITDNKKHYEEYKNEKYLRSNKYAIREELFKKIIGKVIEDKKEIREEIEYLKIKLNEDNIMCAVIKVSNAGKFDNYDEADINLLEFSVLNIVDEIINDFFIGYSFKWTINEYVVMFSEESNLDENNITRKIEDMSERIINMLKQYFNIEVNLGVSNINKGLKSIGNAYSESYKALQQSFYKGTEKVIFYNDMILEKNMKKDVNLLEADSLLKYIELGDLEAIQIVFDNIISFFNSRDVSKETAYDFCAKITYLVTSAVEKDEKSLQMIFGHNNIFQSISKLNSIEEIIAWLKNIEKGIYNYLLNKSSDQNNKLISMAKKFVKENVANVINLQDVASRLNISSGYLSTIFKQSTGISFIDYVTEIKIEEAKKLLKESNYKIYEIAEMTGYENAYYFSKVFKKVTGITPREYIAKVN